MAHTTVLRNKKTKERLIVKTVDAKEILKLSNLYEEVRPVVVEEPEEDNNDDKAPAAPDDSGARGDLTGRSPHNPVGKINLPGFQSSDDDE